MGFDEENGLEWDDSKSALCKRRRGYTLEVIAIKIFADPIGEYTHRNYPDQIRIVGLVDGKLYTLAFEEIEDEIGYFKHLVTYWEAEPWEVKAVKNQK